MLLTLILMLSLATPAASPGATPAPDPIVLDPGQIAITITAVEMGDPADVLDGQADGDTAIIVRMTVENIGDEKVQTGDLDIQVVSDGKEYKLWKAASCGGEASFINPTHIRPSGRLNVQACFVIDGDGKDLLLEIRHATEGGDLAAIALREYLP